MGRVQHPTIINESGLYSLILSSKMPRSKEFKRWVTSEILPTIRRTGGYVANEDMFVDNYLPFPPSIREICAGTNYASTSSVDRILVELEKRGMIKRLKGRNRAIAVCESALQETEVRR